VNRFIFLTFNGLSVGMVYAAVALALVLIWRSTRVLNFAQGTMATVCAYIAITVQQHTGSYWVGFVAALAAGFVLGIIVERLFFRRLEGAPPLNSIVIGVGLLTVFEAGIAMIYGGDNRALRSSFSQIDYQLGHVALFANQDIFTVGSVLGTVVVLALLFTKTDVGLRMRAAAYAPEVARLLGVRVSRMLTLGWALAGLIGALAGLLVLPTGLGASPSAMDGYFVLGFTGAVVGGLDSPAGAVVGGVASGLVITYASGYIGANFNLLAALILLVVVLLLRPAGLFTTTKARQV
jgi:branched-chain amino acid transport system permease protein